LIVESPSNQCDEKAGAQLRLMQKNKMSKFGNPLLNYTKNPCLALENHKINVIMKKQVHDIKN
jgi:hypothetical protein